MWRKIGLLCLLSALFVSPVLAKEKYLKPGPVKLDHGGEKWAQKTLKKMSLEEKVGQLFMVWARAKFLNLNGPEYAQYHQILQKYHVGGFALTVPAEGAFVYYNQPYEAAMLVNQLQRESRLPLIFAADFERGVSMRLQGSTVFPHAMAFGATGNTDYAKQFGAITAQEARAVGVEWNFFPDADVNSNPANPIINTRSFGEDPREVSALITAYIQGAKANGMLTTAKHFPGHGDTATDSHLGLAKVTGDRQRLNAVELPPFEAAIKAGVDSIMVAHVTVPALEPDPNRVATTSPANVTGLLKQQLEFKGLVITDALDMGGLTRLYQNDIGRAAVEAFKAGADMLLIPA
ncbi:MAG TPA: glycoside hydrolase family 3 N-terminal domain-containing protein, partial [Terriglobales bacterium]|nr:glycoside hydrolase family 3 N-terminal domain-containing protein [Terriglobales bacterium]